MWRFSDRRQLGGLALGLVCVLLVLAAFIPLPTVQINEAESIKDGRASTPALTEMTRPQSDTLAPSATNAAPISLRDDPFSKAIQRARADAADAGAPSGVIEGTDLLTAIEESKKRMAPISTASPFGGAGR